MDAVQIQHNGDPRQLPAAQQNQRFGDFVRERRLQRKISVRRMAKMIGVCPTFLSMIELAKTPPPTDGVIRQMAGVLLCDEMQLFRLAGRLPAEVLAQLQKRYWSEIEN
jgi:transcriptional regulator with XRE-family HTH domain